MQSMTDLPGPRKKYKVLFILTVGIFNNKNYEQNLALTGKTEKRLQVLTLLSSFIKSTCKRPKKKKSPMITGFW